MTVQALLAGVASILLWITVIGLMVRGFRRRSFQRSESAIRDRCEDIAWSESSLQDMMRCFPSSPTPGQFYANLAATRGDWAEARLRWATLRARFPQCERIYTGEYDTLVAAGALDEADALLDEIVRRFGITPDTYGTYVKAQRRKENHAALLRAGRRMQKLEPTWPSGYLDAADALAQLGRDDEARAAYKDAIEQHPTNPTLYKNLAQFLIARKDFSAAARVAGEFRQHCSSDPDGYLLGARAACGLGQPDEAIRLLQTGAYLQRHNTAIRAALAELGAAMPDGMDEPAKEASPDTAG